MKVFRSTQPIQRGYGIGGLFRGFLRVAAPIIKRGMAKIGKKGLVTAGKKALEVGINTVGDMMQNKKTFKSAFGNQI